MLAAPAYADLDDVKVEANAVTLTVGGGAATLTVKVTNESADAEGPVRVTVTVPLTEQQVKVGQATGCGQPNGNIVECNIVRINAGQTQSFSIPLTPPANSSLQPGAEANGNGQAELSNGNDASFRVTLKGPSPQQTVTEVSGTVVDQATGSPLSNSLVLLKDSAGTEFTTTTDARGAYRFTGSAAKPIRPGSLTLGANREGYESGTKPIEGQAGRAVTGVKITLKPVASAAPSAPAAVDPSVSAAPSTTDLATPSNTSGDAGTNWLSLLLIGTGVLLVLLGVGAIVLLMMRRKDDRDEPIDDYDDQRPTQLAGAGVPASHGMYHSGATMGGGATMVAPGGPRGGMNDATEIVPSARPQLDEFPDPYAAPTPVRSGYGGGEPSYGGGANGYGGGANGYGGGANGYNGAASGGYAGAGGAGYGSGGGYSGYGDEARGGHYADEPRGGRYADEPRAGRYGADGGYPPSGGGGSGYQGGDYGPRGGYQGEPAATEYQPRRSAYPPPSDYDRPRAGGYGAPPDPRDYDGPGGSGRHDSGGRHGGGGSGGSGGPGYGNSRGRQVGWLDD
jgi:hypothetical protein